MSAGRSATSTGASAASISSGPGPAASSPAAPRAPPSSRALARAPGCPDNRRMPLLSRPGADLHYELAGAGPPLLLIQGVGVTGEGWRPQVEQLAAEFQTLSFDNRGIGRSSARGPVTIEAMAEDARALMDACGWESAHVAGHSMGGVIAQQ